MIDAFLAIAGATVIASSAAIATIAALRPAVRRHCGAAAVPRLWWILALALAIALIPKTAAPVRLQAPPPMHDAAPPDRATAPAAPAEIPWKQIALFAWLAGAMAMTTRLYRAQRRFSRSIAWRAGRHGQLPAGAGPAVVGALAPRLALPADFRMRFSRSERKLIVLHEHVHLRRRDGLANLAMSALLALHWFNPLVHWAWRALGRDQECACDAIVVTRHPRALRTYAEALLKTVAETQHLPLVCRWQSQHPAVERIAMLKLHRDSRTRTRLAAGLLAGGALLASMLAFAGRPAATVSTDAGPDRAKFFARMWISEGGEILFQPSILVLADEHAGMSIHDRDSEAFRKISLVISERAGGIGVEGEYETGADHRVAARPNLIVEPGKLASAEFRQPGGSTLKFSIVVDRVGTADVAAVMAKEGK